MKRNLWLSILIILMSLPALANGHEEQLKAANQLYMDGKYEEAALKYQSIVDSGYASSELYFNLGNAYYKSHDITMALVNYERAAILDPKDPDIQHNLGAAREFIVDRIEVLPEFFLKKAWVGFVKTLDADIWALISVACFISALILLLVYLFSKTLVLRKLSFWTGILLMLVSVSTLLFASQQEKYVTRHNQAIIFTPSVAIKSSPDEISGTDLFLLHEGTMVRIDDELGEWREVVLSDGNRGWLKESDLIRL